MDLIILLQAVTTVAALLAIAASLKSSRSGLRSAKEIALAQIAASKEQITKEIAASVLSANRQAWINDLRNTIASFLVSVNHLRILVSLAERDMRTFVDTTNEAWLHLSRLRLLVNPSEDDHRDLLVLANALFDSISQNKSDHKETERDLVIKGQTVLKREWELVKAGT